MLCRRYYDQGDGGPTVFGWQLSITDTWFITGTGRNWQGLRQRQSAL